MKIDSLMVLACPQSSPPMMLKLSSVIVACLLYMPVDGGRLFKVFLSSLPEGPGSFPYVFFITVEVVTLVAVYDSTFVFLGVLVLGFMSICLLVVLPLK